MDNKESMLPGSAPKKKKKKKNKKNKKTKQKL